MEQHCSWDNVLIVIYRIKAQCLKNGNAHQRKQWKKKEEEEEEKKEKASHSSMNSVLRIAIIEISSSTDMFD